jgi:acetyl-CoA carboxylase carboxyl transferase subunit alpha
VPEPAGGAQEDPALAAENLRLHLRRHLTELNAMKGPELVSHRYEKFRKMGNYFA